MSRSAPDSSQLAHPAKRWFEWDGENGALRYYDKPTNSTIVVELPFTFLLLDELRTVGGWHNASQSGIYANEVRNTKVDALTVRAFKQKSSPLVTGLYADIKDQVGALGGHFVTNCYIAYPRDEHSWDLGSLKFKGAALRAWFEFSQDHRYDLYEQSIRIHGYTQAKKGRITYRVPTFEIVPSNSAQDAEALVLDQTLQKYLKAKLNAKAKDSDAGADDAHPAQPIAQQPEPPDYVSDPDEVPF